MERFQKRRFPLHGIVAVALNATHSPHSIARQRERAHELAQKQRAAVTQTLLARFGKEGPYHGHRLPTSATRVIIRVSRLLQDNALTENQVTIIIAAIAKKQVAEAATTGTVRSRTALQPNFAHKFRLGIYQKSQVRRRARRALLVSAGLCQGVFLRQHR
ncbi:hypothetical protein Plhal304r1_c003g0011881 [Plasmopara halstedii]